MFEPKKALDQFIKKTYLGVDSFQRIKKCIKLQYNSWTYA